MARDADVLAPLGRPSNRDVLPVLGRPSLDWPVEGFSPAGTAIHGTPLHLTGTFRGNNEKSHVPYVGQTTLPMFDHGVGSTFKIPELAGLTKTPAVARVFAGSGLQWSKAVPAPRMSAPADSPESLANSHVSPARLPGSWQANQRHWFGDNGPSQLTRDWAAMTERALDVQRAHESSEQAIRRAEYEAAEESIRGAPSGYEGPGVASWFLPR